MGEQNFKLADVRKLVVIASADQEDLIHHELRRRPHPLADIKGKIVIRFEDMLDHLVDVFRRLLILQRLNRVKKKPGRGCSCPVSSLVAS